MIQMNEQIDQPGTASTKGNYEAINENPTYYLNRLNFLRDIAILTLPIDVVFTIARTNQPLAERAPLVFWLALFISLIGLVRNNLITLIQIVRYRLSNLSENNKKLLGSIAFILLVLATLIDLIPRLDYSSGLPIIIIAIYLLFLAITSYKEYKKRLSDFVTRDFSSNATKDTYSILFGTSLASLIAARSLPIILLASNTGTLQLIFSSIVVSLLIISLLDLEKGFRESFCLNCNRKRNLLSETTGLCTLCTAELKENLYNARFWKKHIAKQSWTHQMLEESTRKVKTPKDKKTG